MIDGALRALGDCFSRYARGSAQPTLAPSGFSGIGATISEAGPESGGFPWFRVVLPGGPAERAGIRDGDRLRSLNGRSLAGLSGQDTAALVRGPDGSSIDVVVSGPSGERSYRLVRAPIAVPALVDRQVTGGIGYLTPLEPFANGLPKDVRSVLDRWNAAGITGWILDLRGVGGGFINPGTEIARVFVTSGPLWLTASRGSTVEVSADGTAVGTQRPLAVLVDAQTNGPALMIASALKETGRARLFGGTGSGCAEIGQSRLLSNGGTLYLTQSRALSPLTRMPITRVGVDEVAARAADGTDRAVAAAVSWLQAQRTK